MPLSFVVLVESGRFPRRSCFVKDHGKRGLTSIPGDSRWNKEVPRSPRDEIVEPCTILKLPGQELPAFALAVIEQRRRLSSVRCIRVVINVSDNEQCIFRDDLIDLETDL